MRHLKWILLGVALVLPFVVLLKKPTGVHEGALRISAVDKASPSERSDDAVLAAPSAKPAPRVTAEDRRQDELAAHIIASKNDNDPRMDRDLKVLGEGAKYLLRQRYSQERAEGLNERGTLVFLLGRNIRSSADVSFLSGVIQSPRCLGLADCSREERADNATDEAHHSDVSSVTLAYPQITALKAIETYLNNGGSASGLGAEARAALEMARHAPDPLVARYAGALLARLGR